MKLSVIVCNQRGNYLNWCLRGIQWQTVCADADDQDVETILVDYGMCPPFPDLGWPRVVRWEETVWNHPRARNVGIANAQGERIAIVNSDCLMAPTLLEDAGRMLDEDPKRQIYWRRFDLNRNGLCMALELPKLATIFDEARANTELWGDFHSLSTYGDFLMVERDVVMEYGGFDERAIGWGVYDHDLSCRLERHGYPAHWGHSLDLVHLWHVPQPGQDADWRRNIDALSPDFQAGRDVRNDGRATFEAYEVGE